jgi:protein subunit release factor A
MQVVRKEISTMQKYSTLFLGYHGLFEEIKDTQELMKESDGDAEMLQLLEDDILRIKGDDENYGQIEEI